VNFSPGVLTSCFELLGLIGRHTLTFPQVRASFDSVGVVPIDVAIESSIGAGWARVGEDGYASITQNGERVLGFGNHADRLRQAILDFIDVYQPFWVQNASFGRAKLLGFAGSAVAQVFLEAGLVDGTDEATVGFWDALAGRARGQKNDRLLSIGREGERLTIDYELTRTGRQPRWISLDSNEDGYDVLSIVGPGDPRTLSIEVKTTIVGLSGCFYLTRNEWDRALEAKNHVFHVWDMSKARSRRLAVLLPKDVEPHVALDQGDGEWKELFVPLTAFSTNFIVAI
jgi:hypothetical protein